MSVATRTPELSGTDASNGSTISGSRSVFAAFVAMVSAYFSALVETAMSLFMLGLSELVENGVHSAVRELYAAGEEIAEQRLGAEHSVTHNIVGAAVTLGLSVIMLILMAIVAGYFVTQAPSDGAFSGAIDQVEDVGGTAFILLAVALLAVPVVAIVGYFMRSGLSGFIGGGGMRR